jgi:ABC-type molybdate transport system permease subunit
MPFSPHDWAAIALTLRLATTTMVLLLVLCTPLAWWLAHTPSRWRGPVSAVVALPLVLPPTVIGFYLLVTMGPQGPIGQFTQSLGLGTLPFTFWGLVVGSLIYSLPFAITCDSATKPSAALPVATNWWVCAMFSPCTKRGCSRAARPSLSSACSAAMP